MSEPVTILLAEAGEDAELKAISYIGSVLDRFSDRDRHRILAYCCWRFSGIKLETAQSEPKPVK